ncbi:MAG TPA: MerR family transcriptional regulator [Rhodobacterales bacterium]|nr:MerR family transcriptional regulator [Rhodobacterales bacterium]
MTRIKATQDQDYTIGALARASGVTVRTLHHYDALGLLCPARVAQNGYRVYRQAEALRLQEILFYRAAGMPLAEIAAVLDEGDRVARLEAHRARLHASLLDQARMLAAVDHALASLKGETDMTLDRLYEPFAAQTQEDYEAWLVETYGADMARAISAAKEATPTTAEGMAEQMAALREIEAALVAAFEAGLDPAAADLAAHRAWVGEMWGQPCSPAAHAGLADLYLSHPDFIARYEALAPGFSQWLTAAMKAAAR